MILIATTSKTFSEGDAIHLETTTGSLDASVVARMPHSQGLRYQVALTSDWTDVFTTFPAEVEIRSSATESQVVGAVRDGTTARSIEFQSFSRLQVGSPVSLRFGNHILLYQVARLRLAESSWSDARAVLAYATARLVGWPEPTGLRGGTHLPKPHQLVYRSPSLTTALPGGFCEIGHVKETGIRVGFRTDTTWHGHIAVLGMSGMGKTAVSQRICRALESTSLVVALDTTGEYTSKLQVEPWTADSFHNKGYFVYEPGGEGDLPTEARDFLASCLAAGRVDYQEDKPLIPRVVLLEEAHVFVPEFVSKAVVNESARTIMQARKYGMTLLMVFQTTAVVAKSALSQCDNYIIFKTLSGTSLKYAEGLVGPEMRDAIPGLQRYEAICVGPAFNADEPIIVTLSPP
jgi:hypothetical protein